MTNLLAAIDQTPDQHYSIWEAAKHGSMPTVSDNLPAGSALQVMPIAFATTSPIAELVRSTDLDQSQMLRWFTVSKPFPLRRPSPVSVHLAQARAALANLAASQHRAERDNQHRQALRWLSENRRAYAGQWIALQGSQLLASGKTAEEVYSRVLGERPPALVIRIEAEEIPFGGW